MEITPDYLLEEILIPAHFPFRVRNFKLINDTFELVLMTPHQFDYVDEHFLLYNKPLVEKNLSMDVLVGDIIENYELVKLGDYLPLKKKNPDYYPEIYFNNYLFENLLNFRKNEYVEHVYMMNNDIIYNTRKYHFNNLS